MWDNKKDIILLEISPLTWSDINFLARQKLMVQQLSLFLLLEFMDYHRRFSFVIQFIHNK